MDKSKKGFKPGNQWRFKPGQSGNPLGAKLHNQGFKALKDRNREYMAEIIEVPIKTRKVGKDGKMTEVTKVVKLDRGTAFVMDQFARAMRGDRAAAKNIWNYHDGLPDIHGTLGLYSEPYDEGQESDEIAQVLKALRAMQPMTVNHARASNGNGSGDGHKNQTKDHH